jgi:hypothetical protein
MYRVNHIASPEKGQRQVFKRYLLRGTWRHCEGCGTHPRNLIVRCMNTRIAWVCKSCSGKLIFQDWGYDVQMLQEVEAYYNVRAEALITEALTRELPFLREL